jgi:FMN phosphatase YigB (HAD superfamily)
MRVIRLPTKPRALLFDLDSTLYTNPEYAAYQNDILIEELARARGLSLSRAKADVEEARARIARRTGSVTSLGNAMADLGIAIPTSVEWRVRLIRPSEWLNRDEKLLAVLSDLTSRYSLAVVTNNPRFVGEEALKALGVRECFRSVVGLDDTMLSKPAREPFLRAAKSLGTSATACVSIGDRYDVDIAIPLDLGMGAILVDGVQDVYRLIEVLC